MRKFTLIILSSLIAFCGYSQKVVITSPASIAGSYTFGTGFGAALLDSIWCAEIVLMDDGVGTLTDGCEQTTNDYTGKIVMIDRGACEFGTKALFAENVGAVGVIIVNNQNTGAIGLGAGMNGGLVTIPTVSLSMADGDIIKPVLANETVSICIGNKIYMDDLTTGQFNVLIPFTGTVPASQVGADSSYVYTPILNIVNSGQNDATNVTATADIEFTPDGGAASSVYSESLTVGNVLEDSTSIQIFPDFLLTDPTPGTYTVTLGMTSADATDEDPSDNAYSQSWTVSNDIAAKCSWDFDTGKPTFTNATTIAGGGPIAFVQGIDFPEGLLLIDSINYTISINDAGVTTLDGQDINVSLSEWNDADGDFGLGDGELNPRGVNSVSFDASSTAEENVTQPLFDTQTGGSEILVEPGMGYFVELKYLGANIVTFGFDNTYDNLFAFEQGFANSDMDWPYLFSNTFPDGTTAGLGASLGRFTAFGSSLSVGYYTHPVDVAVEEVELNGDVSVHPNPAVNDLWVNVDLNEMAETLLLTVYDSMGKLLSSRKIQNVQEDKIQYNTARLSAGSYYIQIRSENQIKTIPFVIVK